jgi:hypothetical protein
MGAISYPPPVDKLLTYGKPELTMPENWLNYLELGFTPEHIPDLIRLATDKELNEGDPESLEVWAPVHAWRTLGQLHAETAVEPLLHLYEEMSDDDWTVSELPRVYGTIGPAAIPMLKAYVADTTHDESGRINAQTGLEEIATMHLEARNECVAILSQQLELFEENDPTLNAYLIASLVNLKALEALPLIEQVFAADRVDEFIIGDWDDVQIELGLKEAPPESPMLFDPFERRGHPISPDQIEIVDSGLITTPNPDYFRSKATGERKASQKAKNKMAKQSRKKNRKRK